MLYFTWYIFISIVQTEHGKKRMDHNTVADCRSQCTKDTRGGDVGSEECIYQTEVTRNIVKEACVGGKIEFLVRGKERTKHSETNGKESGQVCPNVTTCAVNSRRKSDNLNSLLEIKKDSAIIGSRVLNNSYDISVAEQNVILDEFLENTDNRRKVVTALEVNTSKTTVNSLPESGQTNQYLSNKQIISVMKKRTASWPTTFVNSALKSGESLQKKDERVDCEPPLQMIKSSRDNCYSVHEAASSNKGTYRPKSCGCISIDIIPSKNTEYSAIPVSTNKLPLNELAVNSLEKACESLCKSAIISVTVDSDLLPPQTPPSPAVLAEKESTTSTLHYVAHTQDLLLKTGALIEMTQNKSGGQAANVSEKGGGESGMGTHQALIILATIFLVSLASLTFVYRNFPELEEEEYQHLKLPTDIDDAKNLGRVLSHYKDRYYAEVLLAVFVTYIFLQTFAVPGSIFLSILSGFLFRWEVALLLICFCSATGASFCYLLSYLVGRPVVLKYLPERTRAWQQKVEKQGDNLLFYIIFLRITPFLPNWFINITSPVINVPLWPFWLGTFLGVAPPSVLAVQAGTTLYQLTSSRDAFSFTSVVLLGLAALLSLVPIILKNRLREKFD